MKGSRKFMFGQIEFGDRVQKPEKRTRTKGDLATVVSANRHKEHGVSTAQAMSAVGLSEEQFRRESIGTFPPNE